MALLCLGIFAGLAVIMMVTMVKQFIYVCRPNEILIFSGREHTLPDGTVVGYRVVHGGYTLRVPVLEKVDRMDLRTIPIDIRTTNAYSRGNIPLSVSAVAYVKIASEPNLLSNAIERFLGRDPDEIRRVAKESLEGHLRGVLARMTPEEVNEDRLRFSNELVSEAGEDLDRLGIHLDALKVQSVSDDVQYLDSIGREQLANVISRAEISESTAKADAESAQAEAARQGEVAVEQAETAIKNAENEMRKLVAELEAVAKAEEERAEQAAKAARAKAEQKLQEIRARLAKLRLQSDVVLPAEANRLAAEYQARAEASAIAADGQAMAEVLRLMNTTWNSAGPDAKDIFVIQRLETLLAMITERIENLDIGEVTIIDDGSGTAMANHVASLPNTVAAVLGAFSVTTGVDITDVLAPKQLEKELAQ